MEKDLMDSYSHLEIYSQKEISNHTRIRRHENKMGERVQVLHQLKNDSLLEALEKSSAKFVVIGLPEDIGVRANGGRGGAYSAWIPALSNLLNTQSNQFLSGEEILILGHINFDDLMLRADSINFKTETGLQEARKLVGVIDERVYPVVKAIIQAGKEAIIIGGGHNNSYPSIKAAAKGLYEAAKIKRVAINSINCDAHTDFRPSEGRHSGNGFRYAFNEKFLDKYAIVGLHESYNAEKVLDELNNKSFFHYSTFEDIFIIEDITFKNAVSTGIDFVKENYCGIELDMDTIQNIPSSAKTSSGINTIQARQYVTWCAQKLNCCYLHIAEAAPVLSHIKTDNKTGKLIAYLITDYIKARKAI